MFLLLIMIPLLMSFAPPSWAQIEKCNIIARGFSGAETNLSETEKQEILDLAGQKELLLARSESNHTADAHVLSSVKMMMDGDPVFDHELNIEKLLVREEEGNRVTQLTNESRAIFKNFHTPLLDSEEIIKLQNGFREIIVNPSLKKSIT